MRIVFTRWRSGGLLNRPSPRKRLLPKKKTSSGFEFVSGLAAGASAMPAKWSRRVFSFRFYEGKISAPVTLTSCAFRKSYCCSNNSTPRCGGRPAVLQDFSIRLFRVRIERGPLRALPHCFRQKERLSEMVRIDALAASFRLAYCTTSRSTRAASCCSRWRNACSSAMK